MPVKVSTDRYRFHFSGSLTLLTAILVGMTTSLGFWQLDRAKQKREIAEERTAKEELAPIELLSGNNMGKLVGQRVWMQGRFNAAGQFFLDNQTHRGRSGYHHYVPLQIATSGDWVLVNRGWIETGISRDSLPEISLAEGELRVSGKVIAPPQKSRFLTVSEPYLEGEPDRWLFIDLERYRTQRSIPVQPVIIQQSADDPHGLLREWPKIESKVGMHIGYAIQWFAFSLILVVIYLTLSISKKNSGN